MCLKHGALGSVKLQSLELETLLLEALDDLSNQATLNAIRLDHNVRALLK